MPEETSRSFADETSIHGIPEIWNAQGWTFKLLWLCITLGAFGWATKGAIQTTLEYIQQPTITQVAIGTAVRFPPVAICQSFWVSERNLKEKGMNQSDYESLGRLFIQKTMFVNQSLHYDQAKIDHARFRQKMRELDMPIDKFIREIANDLDQFVRSAEFYDGDTTSPANQSIHLTAEGPCMVFRQHEDLLTEDLAGSYKLSLNIHRDDLVAFGLTAWKDEISSLNVGDAALSVRPQEDLPIIPCQGTVVKVRVTGIRRLNTMTHRCNEQGGDREFIDCKMASLQEKCREQGKKPFYSPGTDKSFKIDDISTYLKDENETGFCDLKSLSANPKNAESEFEDVIESEDGCRVPCRSWIYEGSIMPLGEQCSRRNKSYSVEVSLLNPQHSLVFRELYATSFDGYLSNMGGQVSLWTGASMISAIHVLVFFACTRKSKKKAVSDR